jgi:hypothetical protein
MNTAMALVLGFYLIPVGNGRSANLLRAWLQEFAWTEAAAPRRVALRNARLAGSSELAAEPMFSVELAVQLLYWANLVYSPQRGDLPDAEAAALATAELGAAAPALGAAPSLKGHALSFGAAADAVEAAVDTAVKAELGGAGAGAGAPVEGEALPAGHGSLPVALALFPGLADHRVVFEPRSDTRALVAWGGGRLVVAFKGTSSFENVKTDLSFFKTTHPPARVAALSATFGLRLLRVPIRVHGGFLAAFQAVDAAVLAAAGEALAAAAAAGAPPPRLLVAGHSLGGALATLAAHALVTKFPELAPRAAVYTYGAPRVGNRAFALEFDALVPNCFALINDQDPVPRVRRFHLLLYLLLHYSTHPPHNRPPAARYRRATSSASGSASSSTSSATSPSARGTSRRSSSRARRSARSPTTQWRGTAPRWRPSLRASLTPRARSAAARPARPRSPRRSTSTRR